MEVTKYLLLGMILRVKRNPVGKDTPNVLVHDWKIS